MHSPFFSLCHGFYVWLIITIDLHVTGGITALNLPSVSHILRDICCKAFARTTIMDKIYETNSSFHVK